MHINLYLVNFLLYRYRKIMTLELISFKEYPEDQYTKAVAVVCLDGKYNIAYGKKITKDGKCWWGTASLQVTENGKKEYIDGFSMDSNKENTKILEFIKGVEK